MSTEKQDHLSPEELARSAVDEESIRKDARVHLEGCSLCREERGRIMEQLALLGKAAKMYAPESARRVVLPSEGYRAPRAWLISWQPSFRYAFSIAVVVLLVFIGYNSGSIREGYLPNVQQEAAEDEQLMAEVGRLAEDSLPDAYREISPEYESENIDEDALDFVVPIDELQV